MGFLDNSTNNIIVDAVLTDAGRKALAAGNFTVVNFAFGDDEVDYSMIKKFGRTIGKQKIELNTPVFEAQTNSKFGLKYKLLSFSSPVLGFIPSLTANPESLVLRTGNNQDRNATVLISQTTGGSGDAQNDIQNELSELQFIVTYNDKFISLGNQGASATVRDEDGFKQSIVQAGAAMQNGGSFPITLEAKSLTQQDFDFLSI